MVLVRKIIFALFLLLIASLFFYSNTFTEIAAGVAILLFGMIMLEEGFNAFVQGPLQQWLKKSTDKLYKSLSLGFIATAFLQSSSLISVLTISFLSAGLLDLYAGIGIIFGSNLGTTATAWLVSTFGLKIKVSALAMPMLAFGIIFTLQKTKTYRGIGYVLAGLGFFFLGIYFMKDGFDIYKESFDLAAYSMTGFWGLMTFCFIGILITLVLQSSSAAMALILTALAVNQITYENALALAIGANVGTTITAVLGSLSANISGKRLAGAHFIFNINTGIVALIFVSQLGQLVDYLALTMGISNTNYVFKLALFHTIFNLVGIIIMLPFIRLMVKLLHRVFREKVSKDDLIEQPKYLNKNILTHPQTAYYGILNESKRLFDKTIFEVVSHGLHIQRSDIKGTDKLKDVVKKSTDNLPLDVDALYKQKIKLIYSKIIKYATLSESKFTLSAESTQRFTRLKLANRNLVEVVKRIQGLHKNVSLYMNSENEYIKNEYYRLRKKVSAVLREVYQTRKAEQPEEHLKKLQKLKLKVEKIDVLLNGSLAELIENHKISSAMATSLANDSASVSDICERLIETAELLYMNSDTLITDDITNGENGVN